MEQNDENEGYDEKQRKRQWMMRFRKVNDGICGEKTKPKWPKSKNNQMKIESTNQSWFEMTTFKTEQKHENQEENKEITEIDEKQKKIDGNDWNRWVSRIHKKTQ